MPPRAGAANTGAMRRRAGLPHPGNRPVGRLESCSPGHAEGNCVPAPGPAGAPTCSQRATTAGRVSPRARGPVPPPGRGGDHRQQGQQHQPQGGEDTTPSPLLLPLPQIPCPPLAGPTTSDDGSLPPLLREQAPIRQEQQEEEQPVVVQFQDEQREGEQLAMVPPSASRSGSPCRPGRRASLPTQCAECPTASTAHQMNCHVRDRDLLSSHHARRGVQANSLGIDGAEKNRHVHDRDLLSSHHASRGVQANLLGIDGVEVTHAGVGSIRAHHVARGGDDERGGD
ncbi:unnamed protein product [Closterium sp. Naga37s-1]|nr:unnamed protein product [Closterium sp. Naga37s-1]